MYYLALVIILLILAWYHDNIRTLYRNGKLAIKLLSSSDFERSMSEASISLLRGTNYAIVMFDYNSQYSHIVVQYNIESQLDSIGVKVDGIKRRGNNEIVKDLTQPPGVKYTFTANDIKMDEIKAIYPNGEIKIFTGDDSIEL